jgi:hypothetical protein
MRSDRFRRLLSVFEAATGAALLVSPSAVTTLIFGSGVAGAGESVARIAGAALVGLGFAFWPGARNAPGRTPVLGMLAYSILATGALVWSGLAGGSVGVLLGPAVVAHVAIAGLLVPARARQGASDRPGGAGGP